MRAQSDNRPPPRIQSSLTAATKGITPATATATATATTTTTTSCSCRGAVENLRGLRRNMTLVVQRPLPNADVPLSMQTSEGCQATCRQLHVCGYQHPTLPARQEGTPTSARLRNEPTPDPRQGRSNSHSRASAHRSLATSEQLPGEPHTRGTWQGADSKCAFPLQIARP